MIVSAKLVTAAFLLLSLASFAISISCWFVRCIYASTIPALGRGFDESDALLGVPVWACTGKERSADPTATTTVCFQSMSDLHPDSSYRSAAWQGRRSLVLGLTPCARAPVLSLAQGVNPTRLNDRVSPRGT